MESGKEETVRRDDDDDEREGSRVYATNLRGS